MTHRPVGAGSSFAFSAGAASTSSSAFTVQSSVLRVVAVNAAAHVAIGTSPSAAISDYYIPAGQSATLALTKASNRVVGITTGTTTTVIVPEGTQVPFGVGDFVTVSATGQPYYDISHVAVLSVDTITNFNGYHQTRMVIDYNSSGISTTFGASYADVRLSQKISAYGYGGSGILYYQQVQITGQA
jgi:hypothetical protein